MKQKYTVLLSALFATTAITAQSQDLDAYKLQAISDAKTLNQNAVVLDAIKKQNDLHATFTEAKILELDVAWRSEVKSNEYKIVSSVKTSKASSELSNIKESSQGTYGEIFIMDNKGLNVAMSDVTSDYWQGDEAKWQKTYLMGADAVHTSDVEFDESVQAYTSQISTALTDETGAVIGAITFGVIME
ncbi:MAG: hypothetical protein ACI9TY_001299 [Alphaproteobacteria bacterium]|jgi:hypothetical protein